MSVESKPLDSRYFLATVTWRVKLQQGSAVDAVEASATYVLAGAQGDALSIVFQLDHQDLASAVQERMASAR